MKKISRERFDWLKQKHYELWDWLAKNPDQCKQNWAGFKDINEYINEYCFACQFDEEVISLNNIDDVCAYCPLGAENIGCKGYGLYYQWSNEHFSMLNKSKLAKQIRDLPWSEEYVEE